MVMRRAVALLCCAGGCSMFGDYTTVEVGPWSCLDNVVEGTPDPSRRVDLDLELAYAEDGIPVTDVAVDVCEKLDVDCTGASTTDFPKGLPADTNGLVSIDVAEGFDGYLRITSPTIVDSRVYIGRPLLASRSAEVPLLTPMGHQALVAFALTEEDPTRGTALLLALDCSWNPGANVAFEVASADVESSQFYLIDNTPLTGPEAQATSDEGYGGYFNLPVGATVASAYRIDAPQDVGQTSFQVVASTISYVWVGPTPE